MKYMGSKNRIAKYLLPIMLKDRKEGQYWVEPFVGGANMIDKVDGNRIGADSNKYLVALLHEMQKNDFSAPYINEQMFGYLKENREKEKDWLIGFIATQLTYGATWFGSYRRDSVGTRDYADEAARNIDSQSKKIKDIKFINCSYQDLIIPKESIIYCDPPYEGTAKYKGVDNFNHEEFWQWCRSKVREGHTVFISEYNAPEDFECIWEKEIVSSLTKDTGSKKAVEKLFEYSVFY